jgi:hypothetical protein
MVPSKQTFLYNTRTVLNRDGQNLDRPENNPHKVRVPPGPSPLRTLAEQAPGYLELKNRLRAVVDAEDSGHSRRGIAGAALGLTCARSTFPEEFEVTEEAPFVPMAGEFVTTINVEF